MIQIIFNRVNCTYIISDMIDSSILIDPVFPRWKGLNYQCWMRFQCYFVARSDRWLVAVPCWRYTCASAWSSLLIWTPHSLPINPWIPPATSVTSRRIATYRAAPFRAPFRLHAKGALFSSHLNLPRIRLKNHSMNGHCMCTDRYIDYYSEQFDWFFGSVRNM